MSCYYPNGTLNPIDDFVPCPPAKGSTYSMCCATQNRGNTPDYCQRDANGDHTGFCLGGGDSYLYRNSCSDKNWGPDCLKLCVQGHGNFKFSNNNGDMASSDWPVTTCGDGMYCCGQGADGTNCCETGEGFYLINMTAVKERPASVAANGPTATVFFTSTASSDSKLDGGAIAGSAIGGLVVGLIIAAIAFCVFTRVAANRRPQRLPEYSDRGSEYGHGDPKEGLQASASYLDETSGQGMAYELSGTGTTAEMAGSSAKK